MVALNHARVHLVYGASWRLREQVLSGLLVDSSAPIKHANDPKPFDQILLGLDTPSLFEPPATWVIRASDGWLKGAAEQLLGLIQNGNEATDSGGRLILMTNGKPKQQRLVKALEAGNAVSVAEGPGPRELESWLIGRLHASDVTVQRPQQVAAMLITQHADDVDGLLGALEVAELAAGDQPLTAEIVAELVGSEAAEPIWRFVDAVLSGQSTRALQLVHAAGGLEPNSALAALAGELRKSLAALIFEDDAEAGRVIGLRGRPRLYHARKRARELGRRCLERLLSGVLAGQREVRRGGVDSIAVLEMFVLNAQRVIRLGDSGKNAGRGRRLRR